MKRRELFVLIGGAVVAAPLGARAQSARVPTIGVLVLGNPPPEPFLKVLRDGLRDAGYSEGRNIRLEIRIAGGNAALLTQHAADLVRLKVDIIVAYQTPSVTAARQATSEIPIVMSGAGDPLGTGLIASYARPGGNVTGVTGGTAETAGKVVELIREVIPAARRFAVLANETDPFTKPYLAAIGGGARSTGIEMEAIFARPGEPLDEAFATIVSKRVDAVIVQPSILRGEVVDRAMKHRLPSFSSVRELPALGGLMSYGANFNAAHRETATYVDKILKGSKPADLAASFPTKFDVVINLKTANALGLTVPPLLLAQADEIIE
jgi:putative tryptophan/tyrosine transport system substrate-binding protein